SSRDLAREALRVQRQFGHAVGTAHCFEILAWIASAHGDHARAARLLGAADVLWETTDAQLFPYLTGQKDGCAQRTRSALGARAYDESHRQGLRSSTDDNVAFALDESVVRRQPEADDEPQLTKRELEIAELVATGASNKDIAVRLVTSPRTIESHVAHILAKLGFNSRAQIASWVAAQQAVTRGPSS
ncbi:MAG: response regulator transcription factor, partial [Actinomycetes bacterium]